MLKTFKLVHFMFLLGLSFSLSCKLSCIELSKLSTRNSYQSMTSNTPLFFELLNYLITSKDIRVVLGLDPDCSFPHDPNSFKNKSVI